MLKRGYGKIRKDIDIYMTQESRPNIITIVADDLGVWGLGSYGNHEIRTPHLDQLASTGIRFENFFCTSPVCSPARASLLTGRIPSQHGVHDWIRRGNQKEDRVEYLAGLTGFSDLLSEAGYQCAFSGKWHLGDSSRPQKGYTHWYTHQTGGGTYYNAPMYQDGEAIHEPGYVTDRITDKALVFLEHMVAGEAPFHLAVHYTAPHSPWVNNHPPELVAAYEDCPFYSCLQEEPHPWVLKNTVPEGVYETPYEHLKGYFASVTAMDANIGRILSALEQHGILKNSFIFFTSDNGYNCGHHGIWGKGNGTYPLNMYDTSVKVPTLISLPGGESAGTVCEALLSHYDLLPTLMDLVGISLPDAESLPGSSFLPVLRGEKTEARSEVVVFDEYGPVRMIRNHEWKYVHRYPYGPHELFDLIKDPGERHNLVEEQAYNAVRESLKAQLDTWFLHYVEPDRDGIRESVYGKGQLGLCGTVSKGKKVFADDIQ